MRVILPLAHTEAEFPDEIHTNVFRVFLLAIQSHLHSFDLGFIFLQTHATSYRFYSAVTVHCTFMNLASGNSKLRCQNTGDEIVCQLYRITCMYPGVEKSITLFLD
jgi:hypothetical protein